MHVYSFDTITAVARERAEVRTRDAEAERLARVPQRNVLGGRIRAAARRSRRRSWPSAVAR